MRYTPRRQEPVQEFEELERVLGQPTFPFLFLETLNAAPGKPQDGMIAKADGVNWNPGGGGAGVYCYYAAAWNRLG